MKSTDVSGTVGRPRQRVFHASRIVVGLTVLSLAPPAHAANWLMLQGTEPPDGPPLQIWGFVQPAYTNIDNTTLRTGGWAGQNAAANQVAPDLTSPSQFGLNRARVGVRGQNIPLSTAVNYVLLAEFANTGVTKSAGGSAKLVDASVTLSYIPHLRIRVGQFKYPGAEEGLQANPYVNPYIFFTSVTDQLLLERFFDGDGSDTTLSNAPNGPVGAFRDVGVQAFEALGTGAWEYTYALMVGNGNGLTRGDTDNNQDFYAYLAVERIFDGEGPRREGHKVFAWSHHGTRTLTLAGAGEYDRVRYGVGSTFRGGRYRAFAEYVWADGMIPDGTDGGAVPGATNNAGTAISSYNVAPIDRAYGWYADLGYAVVSAWDVNVRYDVLHRRTKSATANERRFQTLTLGTQYHFSKKNRLTLNYEFRTGSAPNLPTSNAANQILSGVGNRLAVQLTTIF